MILLHIVSEKGCPRGQKVVFDIWPIIAQWWDFRESVILYVSIATIVDALQML